MESDNGRKRGFGPHGEGCECEEYEQNEAKVEEPEPTETPDTGGGPRLLFSVQSDPNDLTEMMFGAISDAYAQQLSDLLLFCEFDGVPLSERQVVRLIGAFMRGHAAAKSAAEAVRQNYMLAAIRARMANQPTEAEIEKVEPPAEEGNGLRDVSELFREDPPE